MKHVQVLQMYRHISEKGSWVQCFRTVHDDKYTVSSNVRPDESKSSSGMRCQTGTKYASLRDIHASNDSRDGRRQNMGYDWDAHRQTCYRLFIEERQSLDSVMEYMRIHHKFNPR